MEFVEIHQECGVTIVTPLPSFNRAFFDSPGLCKLAEAIEPAKMILDMRSVTAVGTAFMGLLASLKFTFEKRPGSRFALCNATPKCRELIEFIKRERKPRFFETREEAIAAFGE